MRSHGSGRRLTPAAANAASAGNPARPAVAFAFLHEVPQLHAPSTSRARRFPNCDIKTHIILRMKHRHCAERNFERAFSRAAQIAVLVLLCAVVAQPSSENKARQSNPAPEHAKPSTNAYVGSQECALCHNDIYEKYSRTDMGRSMVKVDAALLKTIPTSASVFDQHLNRHFEQYTKDGALYQSEFEVAADGKEVFRETHKVDWIIGAGANGFGGIVQRADYLFETPLSFYSNVNAWALSPGYQYADYGFSRAILPGCTSCHSGRPQAVLAGDDRESGQTFRMAG
ncbi:MAG: hypothetical protein DMG62_13790 [Acidobacteria bacterium]|nr:MAG: hypothetical protein DMG62_13790 [Acidobacteriota bacterium]